MLSVIVTIIISALSCSLLIPSSTTNIDAFVPITAQQRHYHHQQQQSSTTSLSVLQKPKPTKEIAKIEQLKVDSDYLRHPLLEVRICFILFYYVFGKKYFLCLSCLERQSRIVVTLPFLFITNPLPI